ncbi:MAG: Dimethylsulfide dehydrogenase subunit alpha [Acidimicrobiales bacterium]|nr:MAG: hypothetical protein EDR02_13590 [Actinomycetota bacterium]MBV6509748.1 Dimethylsulfide dehydrogenase subunit alpha [Acidimicrobiales bacterium]RIK04858.1 MAG: hypothetical protein DCC48_12530 [Acidobacteriota bacterium]
MVPEGRSTEHSYRSRLTWDRVAKGSHCVDCFPANCPYTVFVRDGKVIREEITGTLPVVEEGVPDMNPMGCQKGAAWSRQLDAPDRILHPLRRAGERGDGRWEQITWDQALEEIADAIIDAIEEVGPESIVHEGSPEVGVIHGPVRFMGALGGTVLDVDGSINDFWAGLHQVFGKFYFAPSVDDYFHSDCILIWHCNPAYTQIGAFHYLVEARYRGANLILISPDVNPSHSHVDIHVPVRHGTDAALALAMTQVILEEDLADLGFIRSQTDLALLVRDDTGLYLREADISDGGAEDRFFHAHPDKGVLLADPADLHLDFEPLLAGSIEVELTDGQSVTVEPLLCRLRRMLDAEYRPEQVSELCGSHPDTIRKVARLIATGRTRILPNAGVTKYFHGDLMQRAMALLLAVSGNWGRKGTGMSGWATGLFDGQTIAMAKQVPGAEGAEQVLAAYETAVEVMCDFDPTLTPELAATHLMRGQLGVAGMVPPVFFWYWHAGYRKRWNNPAWADPTMPGAFDDHWNEAMEQGWWDSVASPPPDRPPRVLIEIAGNMLRRSRGGKTHLLEELWPQLSLVVCCDFRMSQTALWSDIVLPATQQYEKVCFGMPTPWTMFLGMTDQATPPRGEARSEWEMLAELCRVIEERATSRGLDSYTDRLGRRRSYRALWGSFTLEGTLTSDEDVADEMVRDSVLAGTIPADSTLRSIRDRGFTRYTDWGMMTMAKGQASPFPARETHAPLRHHIERGDPYPTLTRRAQFLIEHPWFVEAGEDLPVHKEPPPMGGKDHPFRLSSGHNRWSIHAMNTTNRVLLDTHRGKPFVLMNDDDATAKGVADDGLLRVWNEAGEFVAAVRTSPTQRPGALTVYNGFEGFMFPGGGGPNECETGLVKWLHLAGGYEHLKYSPTEWQPVPFDRCLNVSCEAYG